MAKWGEGDPRWIVEERPDATNVNNWHWTEKNAGPWSVDRIKELFKDLLIESDIAELKFDEVEKCEGEASANNRKGKLIFFYEWDLSIKWSGKLKNSEKTYSGNVNVPNLSEENDPSELDVKISIKDSDEEGDKLKDIMFKKGKDIVRKQLAAYISSLKEEFSKGMILPKKDGVKPDGVKTLSSGFNKKINIVSPVIAESSTNKPVGLKLEVTTLNLIQQFQCKAQEFYDALTRIEMVTAFTRAYVKLDATKGGKFELFEGNIVGQFKELKPAERIVMLWRYKQWPEGHFSTVTIDIKEKSDHTEVTVTQTGVPQREAEVTKQNWQRYYWDSMKRAFGFGSFIA